MCSKFNSNALKCIEMPEKCLIWVLMNIIALRYSNSDLITFDHCWSAEFLRPLSNCNEFFFYVYYLICPVDYLFYFFYCSGSHGPRPGWLRVRSPDSGKKKLQKAWEKVPHRNIPHVNNFARRDWKSHRSIRSWFFFNIFSFVRLW